MCCEVSWWMSVETFPIGATVDFIAFAPSKAASLFFVISLYRYHLAVYGAAPQPSGYWTGGRGNGGTGGTGERWH